MGRVHGGVQDPPLPTLFLQPVENQFVRRQEQKVRRIQRHPNSGLVRAADGEQGKRRKLLQVARRLLAPQLYLTLIQQRRNPRKMRTGSRQCPSGNQVGQEVIRLSYIMSWTTFCKSISCPSMNKSTNGACVLIYDVC